ncbi:unnamed protein product [Protopolystoma xenopodis]|uniref:Uncharacterized protein n=1 Tax=Protopolystoma xenopodis TaxID=117903 RepID=A0A448WUY2_9PLAT|nr:unnamed protein product [Protopolystoma xenopodis]
MINLLSLDNRLGGRLGRDLMVDPAKIRRNCFAIVSSGKTLFPRQRADASGEHVFIRAEDGAQTAPTRTHAHRSG